MTIEHWSAVAGPGKAVLRALQGFCCCWTLLVAPTLPAQELLRFGGSNWYPPFHYPATPGGDGRGFDVAILEEVARRSGLALTTRFDDWDRIQRDLANGELDVVPMFVSEERQRLYHFSQPVSVEYHLLFGRESSANITRLADLRGLRVATETASLAAATVQAQGIDLKLLETSSEAEAMRSVLRNDADVALVPATVAQFVIASEDLDGLAALSPPLLPVSYAFAVNAARLDLLAVLDGQLAAMQRDGSLQALRQAWLVLPVAAKEYRSWWPSVTTLVLVLAVLAAWAARVRRQRLPALAAGDKGTQPVAAEAIALLDDLRCVLRDDGLQWVFQPQVSVPGNRVTGCEMLVRWEHPEHGSIPPDRFIGLAEAHGLIGTLTYSAIDMGRSVLQHWKREQLDCSLSINVSANDLADSAMLGYIIEAMRGLEQHIILEITETAIMHDMQRILAAVDQLRVARIRLSLDDYGTGYSSMAYLKEFNFDEIKIDRTFTIGLLNDQRNLMLTRASARLGHELGALVVAEGVEDMSTALKLAELGCDVLQGYLFARPLPLEAFMRFARNAEPMLPPQAMSQALAAGRHTR